MKILKARANSYFHGKKGSHFSNNAGFEVLVDKLPKLEDLRYKYNSGMYYGELDGYVNYFFAAGRLRICSHCEFEIEDRIVTHNELETCPTCGERYPWSDEAYSEKSEGYGGRRFTLTMEDGTTTILRGPWSSNAAAIERRGGFPRCNEVSMIDKPESYERGYTFYASAVTWEKYQEIAILASKEIEERNFGYAFRKTGSGFIDVILVKGKENFGKLYYEEDEIAGANPRPLQKISRVTMLDVANDLHHAIMTLRDVGYDIEVRNQVEVLRRARSKLCNVAKLVRDNEHNVPDSLLKVTADQSKINTP